MTRLLLYLRNLLNFNNVTEYFASKAMFSREKIPSLVLESSENEKEVANKC